MASKLYYVYTDGASKGNPGDAGIGVVITDEDGIIVSEIGEYVGKGTNNFAEYKALIRAIEECISLNINNIHICADSELMVKQLCGAYKVKSENLIPLYNEVIRLLRAFSSIKVSHVLREYNKRADELANDGIKKHRSKIKLFK